MTERNMRIEDLNYNTNGTSPSLHDNHAKTIDARLPRWEESGSRIQSAIDGLISEQEKVKKDTLKIKQNDKLMPRDKIRMLKSARNLSCTINTLLERSKDRLSEYYESQLREKSMSPGKSSFNGFKSIRSQAESNKGRQFNLSKRIINHEYILGNQAPQHIEVSKRYNTSPTRDAGLETEGELSHVFILLQKTMKKNSLYYLLSETTQVLDQMLLSTSTLVVKTLLQGLINQLKILNYSKKTLNQI